MDLNDRNKIETYKKNRGFYNTKEPYVGWERANTGMCGGYPTFNGTSPVYDVPKKRVPMKRVPAQPMIVHAPRVRPPANTWLSMQDPYNPLTYQFVQIQYDPRYDASWGKCNNKY